MNHKFISVIVPCRNESLFIKETINNIISQDYQKEFLEVIIVDGESSDGSIALIKDLCFRHNFIKYISNPEKTVPYALNYGILLAKGEIIIRMDAHAKYPNDYLTRLVCYMELLDADNVGGVWITKAGDNTYTAKAISEATSNMFGIGNAYYRLKSNSIKEVDTVPFGCYRREIFDKIGLFDTDLIRNQDDEFNARLKKNGGKIYLIPAIEIEYFARPTLAKMNRMFYQYGLFKPLVNKKIGGASTLRQFFPLIFLLYILLLPLLIVLWPYYYKLILSILLLYFILNIIFTVSIAYEKKSFQLLPILIITFSCIHIMYGFGYLIGVFRFLILKGKSYKVNVSLSR